MALKELWNHAGEWKESNPDVEKKECLHIYSRGKGRSDPLLHKKTVQNDKVVLNLQNLTANKGFSVTLATSKLNI